MTSEVETFYPDMRDPRVMVAGPRERRPAMAGLWGLAARLTKLLLDAREPLIGQIKLAWWRDMMAMIASDPAALPKGEPLLAELQASWAGQGRSEEHTSELQSLMRISYAVFCLKNKKHNNPEHKPT